MKKKSYLISCSLLCFCLLTNAGETNKKYERLMLKAEKYYKWLAYPKAITCYKRAFLAKGNEDAKAALRIADSYRLINQPQNAEKWYAKAFEITSFSEEDQSHYADVLLKNGKSNQAKELLSTLGKEMGKVKYRHRDLHQVHLFYEDSSAFGIKLMELNSSYDDFSPTFYEDGLVFVSNRPTKWLGQKKYHWDHTYFLDLFYADLTKKGSPKVISKKINSFYHEGPAVFFDKGRKVIFTRNNFHHGTLSTNHAGVNMLKLYYAEKKRNGKWGHIHPLPFNDDHYSVGHPTITSKGVLYFSSDMPGTFGKADIFRSTFKDGQWTTPENLGFPINTEGDELFPFVNEGDTLFFASDHHAGIGGLDIYQVDLNDPALEIQNLGYPINSEKDDFGFIKKGEDAYLSSNRNGGMGSDDIYQIHKYETILWGRLIDAETKEAIMGDLRVIDGRDSTEIFFEKSVITTDIIEARHEEKLIFQGKSKGYTAKNIIVHTHDLKGEGNHIIDVPLTPESMKVDVLLIKNVGLEDQLLLLYEEPVFFDGTIDELKDHLKNQRSVINNLHELTNIRYDFDQSSIRKDAGDKLNKLIEVLNRYPQLEVTFTSHTDSRGTEGYNKKLARSRAKAAKSFLIQREVASGRVAVKHYGESIMVNDCKDGIACDDAKHEQNRRTNIIITGY